MPTILHILTHPADPLTEQIIAAQQAEPDARIEVVDLRQPAPDYQQLLERIFAADAVQVW